MKFVSGLLIFIAGGATGAAVTYVVTKKHFEQQTMDEIDSMRNWINEREKNKYVEEELGDTLDPNYREELIERYRGYLRDLGDEEFEEDIDDEDVPAVNPPDDETGIEEISSEEFTDGFPGYDAMTLSYYAGDNTWVGPDEQIISDDDISIYLGNDILSKIGEITKNVTVETESMFVVNHDMTQAYEIMFLPGSFTNG